MQSIIIATTTQYPLGGTDPGAGSLITFKTVGLTGTCSVIPKVRKPGDGTSNLVAIPYTNANTGLTVAAGTAITADGVYQIPATGPENLLDATVSSGTATIVWWTVEGGVSGGGAGGGGGTGGAVTSVDGGLVTLGAIADASATTGTGTVNAHLRGIATLLSGGGGGGPVPVIVQDPTLTYTQPTGDALGARAIHVSANGEVAAGSSGASLSPIMVGTLDASGNVQYLPMALLNAAPNITTQNAPVVKSVIAANGAANVVNLIGSGQNLGDNGNGANYLAVVEGQWNGTSFDRRYGNLPITTLASSARTTTQISADLVNYNGRFIHVIVNVTSAGTGSITLTINGKDPASATYYPLLVGAAITTNSQNVYRIGVGLTAAANSVANDFVPRIFQFVVTANNANTMTYSLGYNLLN